MTTRPLISIIVCAHNEEDYVSKCLSALQHALKGYENEILLIADRCKDNTVKKSQEYPVRIIEKNWKHWRSSYSESLQIGFLNAKGYYLSIVDADIVVPPNFFRKLIPCINGRTVSVAADVITYPETFLNRLMNAWERTYKLAPAGRAPYGAARVLLRNALKEIGGFRDVPTPDTDVDIRFARHGYNSVTNKEVKVYHMRRIALKTVVNGQINCGRGRYSLGISFSRTLGHALFRFRPFTVYGWLLEKRLAERTNLKLP
jgi:glycosyltransferase involved in cell wall biosynthesis